MFEKLKFIKLPKKIKKTKNHKKFNFINFLTRQNAKIYTYLIPYFRS